MIPFVTPFGVFLLLLTVRHFRRAPYSPADAAAWSLATMLLLTGAAHFIGSMREDMIRMVPPIFPRAELIVTVTGVLELLGAVGLFIPRTRSVSGVALALLFVAMFPANVYAAGQGLTLGGQDVTPLWRRLPEQIIYILMALAPARSRYRRQVSSQETHGGDVEPLSGSA